MKHLLVVGAHTRMAQMTPLYLEAVEHVRERGKPSTSYVQRKLKIGFNRAASMLKAMERQGVIDQYGPDGKVIG